MGIGRVILVEDSWNVKYWYIGKFKSHCDCQMIRVFELEQAWCYLFHFEFSFVCV